eukprot:XP_025011715.1 uncharacterized protein LOC112533558 isoform X1 [Gallus gallus]
MRWRFLWRRVVIGPRRPALCRHHPEPRGGGGGGGHAEVVPGSTLLQRRRAAPGLRAPLQLLRVGVRGWGGCVLLCVVPVGPLRCSGPLLGGGRCPVPPTQEAPRLPLESCRRIWLCPGGIWGRPGSSGLIQKSLEISQRSLGAFRESSCGSGGFWIPRLGLEMSRRCPGETRGSWSSPGVSKTDSSHQKKPPYSHQVMLGQPPVTPGHCCVTITRACLQPDLVTLELSRAVTIMCHQDGDVVVYSAATRGDCV